MSNEDLVKAIDVLICAEIERKFAYFMQDGGNRIENAEQFVASAKSQLSQRLSKTEKPTPRKGER